MLLALTVCIAPSHLVAAAEAAQAASGDEPVTIIPLPTRMTVKSGAFTLGAATKIQAPPALRAIAEQLRAELAPATGLPLPVVASAPARARIVLALDPKLAETLGEEGYRLTVSAGEVVVRAPAAAGVFYGTQTLRQLLPAAVFRRAPVAATAWKVPAVEIEDRPRFKWRGSHLDVARHFMPKEALLKHLDLMALHKLNVFHWHLTDDQGWRIEIKKYPRLTEVGAWRKDSALGPVPPKNKDGSRTWKFRGKGHGGFYSQDDVREVVRYAAERHITVVPEIEMPGHARAALAAYPELGNTGKLMEVPTYWGVFEEVFNVDDKTLEFLQDVLEEVLALFPSRFIHVGGDEVPKREWKESPKAQARMKSLGLKDEHELQSWFIKQMDRWLTAKGRRLIGWEEILEGGLAPGAAIMSWHDEKPGIKAAKMGHDAVMTPKKPLYFDHYASKDPLEPPGIGGHNALEHILAWDPVPKELDEKEAKHVLGAQAQLWSEYMPTPRNLEYMAWPRLAALSEVVWTPVASRVDFEKFKTRLTAHLARLRALDVNYRPLEGPGRAILMIP